MQCFSCPPCNALRFATLFSALILVAACSGGEVAIPPTGAPQLASITIDGGDQELDPGETMQLTVTIDPSLSSPGGVTWSSSDSGVATITSSGLVTAIAPGTTSITAQADGTAISDAILVTVAGISSMSLAGSGSRVVTIDDSLTLALILVSFGSQSPRVEWRTSDPLIATVDEGGVVTGLRHGQTTITATSTRNPDVSASALVTVGGTWQDQLGTDLDSVHEIVRTQTDSGGRVIIVSSSAAELVTPTAGEHDAIIRVYEPDGTIAWQDQFGSAGTDIPTAVAIDSLDRIVITGQTTGNLFAQSVGAQDAFIRVYDPDGTIAWQDQFGSDESEGLTYRDLFADLTLIDLDDRIIVAGVTDGSLFGTGAAGDGGRDIFIRVYDPDGTIAWQDQLGGVGTDSVSAIAVDSGNRLVITGPTTSDLVTPSAGGADAFVRVYDSNGVVTWEDQFGGAQAEVPTSLSIDSQDRIVLSGITRSSLFGTHAGAWDTFVRVYEPGGSVAWDDQFGSAGSALLLESRAVWLSAIDTDDRVIIVGSTSGSLFGPNPSGTIETFIRAYEPTGSVAWQEQLTSTGDNAPRALAIDSRDQVVITGITDTSLLGAHAGGLDGYVRVYTSDGAVAWEDQFGTEQRDVPAAIAFDEANRVTISGVTMGSLVAPNPSNARNVLVRVYGPDGQRP